MADDTDDGPSYADGSLAHPNGPNAYGPPIYQLKSGGAAPYVPPKYDAETLRRAEGDR